MYCSLLILVFSKLLFYKAQHIFLMKCLYYSFKINITLFNINTYPMLFLFIYFFIKCHFVCLFIYSNAMWFACFFIYVK